MWSLDPTKCALLVIDMQNDFVLEGYPMEVPNARKAIPHIQRLISASRELNIPIFYTQHTLTEGAVNSPLEAAYNPKLFEVGMRPGTFGVQVIDDLKPAAEDTVITKYRYNAFHNTLLEPMLKTIRGLNQIDPSLSRVLSPKCAATRPLAAPTCVTTRLHLSTMPPAV